MKFLKSIIVSLILINSAHAADWKLLNTNNANEDLYIDRDSIESLKNSAVKVSFKFNTVGDTEKFVRITSIMRCKDITSTIQAIRIYSYKRDQNIEYEEDQQTTSPINFESRFGDVFNYVCKTK
ncbi:surface-adhesin E family protein [Acinetobacter baumannii]|uniref:surface-adhesin E family protein n=1 Tax=Acinetobacter baumannii TaxID=470 RepID=UPI002F2E4F1B